MGQAVDRGAGIDGDRVVAGGAGCMLAQPGLAGPLRNLDRVTAHHSLNASHIAGLLAHLRTARRDLAGRMAESLDPEQSLPDAGLLRLLADLQGCIAAVEAVGGEEP